MYFEPYNPGIGELCRDGGLCTNNPVQLAVNEHVYLNGDNVPLDIVLSVGSGQGDKPQNTPSTSYFLPEWIYSLFQTFLETMNGERSWRLFLENAPRVIKSRPVA